MAFQNQVVVFCLVCSHFTESAIKYSAIFSLGKDTLTSHFSIWTNVMPFLSCVRRGKFDSFITGLVFLFLLFLKKYY